MWTSVIGFFHLPQCFQSSSTLSYVSVFHSVLWPIIIPVYGYTTFYLSIHQLRDVWVVSAFWLLWEWYCEHSCIGFCVDICFCLSCVYTYERHCWVPGISVCALWGAARLFCTVAIPFYTPTSSVLGLPLCISSPTPAIIYGASFRPQCTWVYTPQVCSKELVLKFGDSQESFSSKSVHCVHLLCEFTITLFYLSFAPSYAALFLENIFLLKLEMCLTLESPPLGLYPREIKSPDLKHTGTNNDYYAICSKN